MKLNQPMGCSQAVERLWDLLDENIEATDRAALDRHLALCVRCCGQLAFARELRSMLHERSQVDLPTDVQGRLEDFIDEVCAPVDEVDR